MSVLSGWKTYIAAAGFVCLAVYHFIEGDNAKALEYLTAAMALFGLRNAVAGVEAKVK